MTFLKDSGISILRSLLPNRKGIISVRNARTPAGYVTRMNGDTNTQNIVNAGKLGKLERCSKKVASRKNFLKSGLRILRQVPILSR